MTAEQQLAAHAQSEFLHFLFAIAVIGLAIRLIIWIFAKGLK